MHASMIERKCIYFKRSPISLLAFPIDCLCKNTYKHNYIDKDFTTVCLIKYVDDQDI